MDEEFKDRIEIIRDLKKEFNGYMKRYLNGCDYCEKNIKDLSQEQLDKYSNELCKILDNMNKTAKNLEYFMERELTPEEWTMGFEIRDEIVEEAGINQGKEKEYEGEEL